MGTPKGVTGEEPSSSFKSIECSSSSFSSSRRRSDEAWKYGLSLSSIGGSNQRASVADSIRGEMEEDGVRKETVSVFLVYGFCVRSLRVTSFSSQVIFSIKHLCK